MKPWISILGNGVNLFFLRWEDERMEKKMMGRCEVDESAMIWEDEAYPNFYISDTKLMGYWIRGRIFSELRSHRRLGYPIFFFDFYFF